LDASQVLPIQFLALTKGVGVFGLMLIFLDPCQILGHPFTFSANSSAKPAAAETRAK
jgi:hypothetical protein